MIERKIIMITLFEDKNSFSGSILEDYSMPSNKDRMSDNNDCLCWKK